MTILPTLNPLTNSQRDQSSLQVSLADYIFEDPKKVSILTCFGDYSHARKCWQSLSVGHCPLCFAGQHTLLNTAEHGDTQPNLK